MAPRFSQASHSGFYHGSNGSNMGGRRPGEESSFTMITMSRVQIGLSKYIHPGQSSVLFSTSPSTIIYIHCMCKLYQIMGGNVQEVANFELLQLLSMRLMFLLLSYAEWLGGRCISDPG